MAKADYALAARPVREMTDKAKQTKKTGKASGHSIVFETYEMPGTPPEPITLTPRHNDWRKIIGQLVDLGVGQWDAEYSDLTILDGSGWSLTVRSKELKIQSSGMNARPQKFDAVRDVIEHAAATAPTPTRACYARKPRMCPDCGDTPIASILYGMPSLSPELMEKEARGEVVFGGCAIEVDGSQPSWQCLKCGAEFFQETKL